MKGPSVCVLAAAFALLGCGLPSVGGPDPQAAAGGGAADLTDAGSAAGGDGAGPPDPTAAPSGATFTSGGVTFRVWAQHASAAWVEGDFGPDRLAMQAEAEGVFALTVDGARVGNRYRYVLETPAGTLTRVDPYCRQLTTDRTFCTLVDPAAYLWSPASFTRPSRNQSVVYELHVGSFAVAAGAPYGTFTSARARLAELAELGVNVVELMPVNAFGGGAYGWGYNPQLFLAPKPTYGTADELRGLIDEAHQHGIAVWLDTVMNHCDGWRLAPLACFDGSCPNNSAGVYFFGAGPFASTPWGPRPNYAEPKVAAMLLDSVKTWLGEYRADGFRFDSVSNIRALDGSGTTPKGRELLVAANALVHQAGGLSVAEDLKGWDTITQPAAAGGFGFDAQWDGFGYDTVNLLTPASDDGRDLGVIERQLKGGYAGDGFSRLLWTENHDAVGNGGARLPVHIDGANPESFAARRRSMLGAVLLLTTPGVPMLFMGQEHLATAGFKDPPAPLAAATAKGQEVRAFYRDLIALRRNLNGQSAGLLDTQVQVLHRHDTNKVIAYQRGNVTVVLNLRNKAYAEYDIGVPAGGAYTVRLDTDWKTYGADFAGGQQGALTARDAPRDGRPYTLPIRLGAYGAVVLTQ